MTTYSVFTGAGGHTGLTPPVSSTSFASPITLGTQFSISSDNLYLAGYKYWVADAAGNHGPNQKFALWQPNTGALTFTLVPAGTVTGGAFTNGAWNTVLLGTPIPLVPGIPYMLATGFTGNFNFTSGFWSSTGSGSAGLSNGPLSMYSDVGASAPPPFSNNQCLFSTSGGDPAVSPPNSANSSFNCWLDAVITDQAPAGISYRLWPNMPRIFPNGATTNDTTGYTLGMQFAVAQACKLLRIWHYSPPGVTTLPSRCLLWDTGTQAAVPGTDNNSPSWSGAAGSGWVSCDYTSAGVTLSSGTNYKVSTFLAPGSTWFAALANYWSTGLGSAGRAAGPLSAPNNASALSPGQDTWHTASFAYPLTSTNPEVHFVDVEVQPITAAAPSGPLLTFFP